MKIRKLKIISRNSPLARLQCKEVLEKLPDDLRFQFNYIHTIGDLNRQISLMDHPPEDFFTRELDQHLLDGTADIAIHSAKDLPTALPDGLRLIALLEPSDRTDSLVSGSGSALADLPSGARIGTSSLRRKEQLLKLRNDLEIVSIRGNIEERISLVDDGEIDALIVATCALKRLSLEHRISEILPFETHPLQGYLAVTAGAQRPDLVSLFKPLDIRRRWGKLSLVGFGPGDPELITVKALRHLNSADVIFYDDLLDDAFLARFQAEKVFVGKRKGRHAFSQDNIHRLLWQDIAKGRNVVRLKGGDPFIFGRGGEELAFFRERLIPVVIVPGITAASAAAAAAGIPLTKRGVASRVTFCTGHPLRRENVPLVGNAVYYMAASNLEEVAETNIRAGRDPSTPVAVIGSASLPGQSIRTADLGSVMADKLKAESPSIVIIGPSAGLYRSTAGLAYRSRFLFTGLNPRNWIPEGDIVHQPLIEIQPLPFHLDSVKEWDWIVFTSCNGVNHFLGSLSDMGHDFRDLGRVRMAVIGRGTEESLRRWGFLADYRPDVETSEALIRFFVDNRPEGSRVLLPVARLAKNNIQTELENAGYHIHRLNVYNTVLPDSISPLDLAEFEGIIFSSGSSVDNFQKVYGSLPGNVSVLATGPFTAKRIEEVFGYGKVEILKNNRGRSGTECGNPS